ncbi:Calcium uniporter protein [Trypanosoma melophagium]|uniref:Calcium uniporter protein n=1 Tax=Trypanosoma melophagium TaxID=715481 RepID=UPI00351A8653|nr:Calcium uniporter protein [Trypanosoma melophagium]
MTAYYRVIRTCSRHTLLCEPNICGGLTLWAARRECSSQKNYTPPFNSNNRNKKNDQKSPMDDGITHISRDNSLTSASLLTLDGLHHYRDIYIQPLLQKKRTELQRLTAKTQMCEVAAERYADRYTVFIFLLFTTQTLILFYWVYVRFDWDLVEPITYLLSYAGVWAGIAYYSAMRQELTYLTFRQMLIARCRHRLWRKHNIDMKLHDKLQAEVQLLGRWSESLEGL